MKIDWLRSIGKTVIISIEGREDMSVYDQRIAVPIVAVIEVTQYRSIKLITHPMELLGDNITEKTTMFDIDTESGAVKIGVAISDEDDEEVWTTIRGTIIEVY